MNRLAVASKDAMLPLPSSSGIAVSEEGERRLRRLERMRQVAERALASAEREGFENYDPADAKGTPIVLWTFARGTPLARLVRLSIYGGLYAAPIGFRKLLGVRPSRYAHASAMLACAYAQLARTTGDNTWCSKTKPLLEWLSENKAEAPIGESWGSPFPWFSYGGVVPTTVGSSHGTMWVANAFLAYYELTGDSWALEHCAQACDFLAYGLNSTEHPSGSLSVSYSIIDRSQCININADSASILVRFSKAAARPAYFDVGVRMLRFVLENQSPGGGWSYDVPLTGSNSTNIDGRPWLPNIDGFHTGMVLSALTQILPHLENDELRARSQAALDRGLSFYMDKLFTADGIPRYSLTKLYPIDAYSCGQAILSLVDACQCDALDPALRKQALQLLDAVADRTVDQMLEPDGSFLTARYRFRSFRLKCLRWAQAVLVLAFERYCELLKAESSSH